MSDWKLVPVEPTAEMLNTWAQKWPEPAYVGPHPRREILGWTTVKSIYQAMLKAAPSAPTQGADGESLRPVAVYLGRIETSDGNEAWVELSDEDRKYWPDTVRSVYATRDAAPIDAIPVSQAVIDHCWTMYQQGQISADHTAKEVFAEVLQNFAKWLAIRDDPPSNPQDSQCVDTCNFFVKGRRCECNHTASAPMEET